MKAIIYFFLFLFSTVTLHASQNIIIVPFDKQRDLKEVVALITTHIISQCTLPEDRNERKKKTKVVLARLDAAFCNNTPVSTAAYRDDSVTRKVLYFNNSVKGMVDYFIRENNHGYIETLCTAPECLDHRPLLIQNALEELKSRNVKEIYTRLYAKDTVNIAMHKELGFVAQDQTELEKSRRTIQFKYTILE